MKTKAKEMLEAIQNFHQVYYSIDSGAEGLRQLHHAACHLFDAAGITTTICADGRNEELFKMAAAGMPAPEDLLKAWEKAIDP